MVRSIEDVILMRACSVLFPSVGNILIFMCSFVLYMFEILIIPSSDLGLRIEKKALETVS
jgi:hypothetical protein